MFSALATAGGGTAARESASARSASRALCGVIAVGSRSGNSGMIWAMIGSSGITMQEASRWTGPHHRSRAKPPQFRSAAWLHDANLPHEFLWRCNIARAQGKGHQIDKNVINRRLSGIAAALVAVYAGLPA